MNVSGLGHVKHKFLGNFEQGHWLTMPLFLCRWVISRSFITYATFSLHSEQNKSCFRFHYNHFTSQGTAACECTLKITDLTYSPLHNIIGQGSAPWRHVGDWKRTPHILNICVKLCWEASFIFWTFFFEKLTPYAFCRRWVGHGRSLHA